MGYDIIWSDFAGIQLDKIYQYYLENAGLKIAKNILQTEIGQIENLLLDREVDYRYLVCGNYKIIYSIDIDAKHIKIADVFDTRQNPVQIRRVK